MRRYLYRSYYLLKFDRTKLRSICLFVLISCGFLIYIRQKDKFQRPAIELQRYQTLLSNLNSTNTSYCQIPQLDPWDPSILKYYEKATRLECKPLQSNVTYIENGTLKIHKDFLGSVNCRYRYFVHNNGVNDFDIIYGEWQNFEKEIRLEKDFVEVECSKKSILSIKFYSYHWSTIVPKDRNLVDKPIESTSIERPSVIMIGVDSQSRSNFIRQLPQTYELLNRWGFVDMKSHVKVHDNTFVNLLAVLLGKRGTSYKEFANEIPDEWYMYFDEYEFIWKKFSEQGYTTFFAEDRPDIGTFNYNGWLYGFKYTPVDHYMRPYWIASFYSLLMRRSNPYCYDSYPAYDLHLSYLQEFLNNYKGKRKFALWWTQDISHEHLNKVGVMDKTFVDFLKHNEKNFDDAIVIVFSDHGNRYDSIRETVTGRLESRLPFLSVHLPKQLQEKYPHLLKHLQENSNFMTTQFDLHAMLEHIAGGSFDDIALEDVGKRAYSLLGPVPTNRSCYQAHVPEDYCPCIQEVEIPIEQARPAAKALLDYVNHLLGKHNTDEKSAGNREYVCDLLELDRINYASVRMPNQKVIKEHMVKKDVPKLVSSGVEFSYRVTLQAKPPSNALIEGVIAHNLETDQWLPTGEIERNNKYGNTSHCVIDRTLKKICHCSRRTT
uniref:Uncharacterized protein n=1 Tax=Acrobeloides nanus TaxID=290746 RepID=A0A914BZ34_9BILA